MFEEEDLQSLKYFELQKLAKNVGIRANQKVEKLIRALSEHYARASEGTASQADGESNSHGEGSSNSISSPLTGFAPKSVNTENEGQGRKRRRTFELEEATLKGDLTPIIENEPRTRLRSSKNNTPNDDPLSQPMKRLCRRTFDKQSPAGEKSSSSHGSPSARAIIDSIQTDCSSAERREKILSAIDKKVYQKMISSPVKVTQSRPSQIPRFMTFLSNKNSDNHSNTPGSKKWNEIHNREFSKFDSIDVYLEKRQQRKENLTNSTKKQEMKNKSPAVKRPSVRKPILKEVDSSKIFKPTVLSTKDMTFNFTKNASNQSKTPKSKVAMTSALSKTPRTRTAVNTPGKKDAPTSTKLPKDVGSTKRASPVFKFTGNTSSLNSTLTASSKKPSFDLKASLARPLTWKPHTGKLQPVHSNHNTSVQKSGSRIAGNSRARKTLRRDSAGKMRPLQAKNVRRAVHLDRRNNQKYVDMMRRRGLMA